MFSSTEVRIACPSISFLFVCLGVSLGVSYTFLPLIENFVFKGSSLGITLADLVPLLCQPIDWFEGLVSEQGAMFEVRLSELETRFSSRDNHVEVEEDTAVFVPREVRAFHALKEVCSLDDETLSRFKGRFQFPIRVRVRLPHGKERACHFSPEEVCFYKAAFMSGHRLPIHPFIIELLGHFDIAPRQLMPNLGRIVVSCIEIWLSATEGDMIKVDELVYL